MWNELEYRHKTFADIYSSAADFKADYAIGFPSDQTIKAASAEMLWYLLYGRYGNDIISPCDENRWKAQLRSIISMYGPTWEKELDIQKSLRALTEADLARGSEQVSNHAFNPSSAPATDAYTALPKIDQQTGTLWKRNKVDGYSLLLGLLDANVTERFLNKFKKLFQYVVEPERPALFITDVEED